MVPYHMLEDLDLQHLVGIIVGKCAIIDEGHDAGAQGVDAFIGPLVHIWGTHLRSARRGLQTRWSLQWHPIPAGGVFCYSSVMVPLSIRVWSLPVFTLQHIFSCSSQSLWGQVLWHWYWRVQEVDGPGVKHFTVLWLLWGRGAKLGSFPVRGTVVGCHCNWDLLWKWLGLF